MDENKIIRRNVVAHNKNVKTYKKRHLEIYNRIEQQRLHESVGKVIHDSKDYVALDYGSGEGNLTKQLLSYGVNVTSADVSDRSLKVLQDTYGVETILLNGRDVDNIPDDTYDFIGLYSVLHHIPDYLYVIENLTPKLKTGGVLYIAHETCASYWDNYEKIDEFKRNATRLSARIKKYLRPRNYINKLRRIFIDPHYAEEGDIHVFRDDHIEWYKISDVVSQKCDIITREDYLLCSGNYKYDEYIKYKNTGLVDTTVFVARRTK